MTVDEKAKDWFVDEVFTSKFGVRALKRLIQEQVETPLSLLIMQDRIHPGQPVFLNVDESGRKLRIYAKPATANAPAMEIKTPEKQPEAEEEDPIEEVENASDSETSEIIEDNSNDENESDKSIT